MLKNFLFLILICLFSVYVFLEPHNLPTSKLESPGDCPVASQLTITYIPTTTNQEIEFKIRTQAILSDFSQEIAVRIAICESQLGKYKTNWEGSSAYGLYQFMPRTWNAYCEGNIKNDDDQIKCFIKLYRTHPEFWECK